MSISRGRRWLTALAATLVAVPTLAVVTASPAQAISCSGRGTGIWETVRSRVDTLNSAVGTRTVRLELRNERVSDYSSAMVAGSFYEADEIWVERLENGTWQACPRTRVGIGGAIRYSDHTAYNRGYTMRACLAYTVYSTYRSTYCTDSYYDQG